jgi:hypothetical protein
MGPFGVLVGILLFLLRWRDHRSAQATVRNLPDPGPHWRDHDATCPQSEGIQPAQDDVTERPPQTS